MKEKHFFELLGFENISLLIDYDDLELKYIGKQGEFFDDSEKQERINFAYEILKNPLKRLEYFFLLKKFESTQEADHEFLENFFELNEEIENLVDKNELNKFYQRFLNEMKEILEKIEFLFNEKNLDKSKINKLYTQAKYVNRILENHFNYK
jgi:DnaJ-domain-containing protein 1